MKKLGKKRNTHEETVQAYACPCGMCPCPSCMNEYVYSFLTEGQNIVVGGQYLTIVP